MREPEPVAGFGHHRKDDVHQLDHDLLSPRSLTPISTRRYLITSVRCAQPIFKSALYESRAAPELQYACSFRPQRRWLSHDRSDLQAGIEICQQGRLRRQQAHDLHREPASAVVDVPETFPGMFTPPPALMMPLMIA